MPKERDPEDGVAKTATFTAWCEANGYDPATRTYVESEPPPIRAIPGAHRIRRALVIREKVS